MRKYFAYGSNMDAAQMAKRCPDGKITGVGRLVGYRFGINSRGVATVVPDGNGLVHGIVWRLTAADEQALDGVRGRPWGTYVREILPIEVLAGDCWHCLVYIAKNSTPGRSKPEYLDGIVGAAVGHGFPHTLRSSVLGQRQARNLHPEMAGKS